AAAWPVAVARTSRMPADTIPNLRLTPPLQMTAALRSAFNVTAAKSAVNAANDLQFPSDTANATQAVSYGCAYGGRRRPELTAPFGHNVQIGALLERGGVDLLAREMPDEWVTELAGAGGLGQGGGRIGRPPAARATRGVLRPLGPNAARPVPLA